MTTHAIATDSHEANPSAARAAQRRLAGHVAAIVRAALEAWRERRHAAATRRDLDQLDDATLRDLGLHRSEAASLAAELHGIVVASRQLSMASRFDARM